MLVACRLAGLSALEGHYVGLNARTQLGRRSAPAISSCGKADLQECE
jgi:hypothetical protein